MANMWPRQIPNWISHDRRRAAEIKVFRKLESELDSSWSVFYSRPWYGISQSGGEIEGEADFILVNPEKGLFFLEVKGGQISYEPERSQWYSTDRHGIKHKIKDPIDQAKKCRYEFSKKLEKLPNWPSQNINFKYGAVFTDTSEPSEEINSIGGHEKFLFCHATEFENNFELWINGRLASGGAKFPPRGPGQTGLTAVHSLIAQPVILNFTDGSKISDEIETLDSLFTGAQLHIIHSIRIERRIVVSGGAGTGKTVLAVEVANLFSKDSRNVLLLTCSSTLAIFLGKRFSKDSNVKVCTVDDYFNANNHAKQWDAVIVDEAQDVQWEKWNSIEKLCVPDSGNLIAFMDSNQAIYRLPADLTTMLGAENFHLNINLRNTRNIAKSTESLYSGPLIIAPGPEGVSPSIIQAETFETAIAKSINLIKELTSVQAVKRNEISVLCRDKKSREKITFELSKHKLIAANANDIFPNVICVETVPSFKGLESNVVIAICDSEWANNQEMAYVSVSRARSRLYLVGNLSGTLLAKAVEVT